MSPFRTVAGQRVRCMGVTPELIVMVSAEGNVIRARVERGGIPSDAKIIDVEMFHNTVFHFIETVKVRSMARNITTGDFSLYF